MTTTVNNTNLTNSTCATPGSGDNSPSLINSLWAKLGFAISLGASGYVKFPTWLGGLVIQWAVGTTVNSADNTQTVNWPISFPTACLIAFTSCFLNTGTNVIKSWGVLSFTTTGVTIELLRRGDEGSWSVTPFVLGIGN
jgi:hypothetical protein